VSRVFLSHSSRDSRQAMAVKRWLIEQGSDLVDEICLDLDPHTGIRPGERWKEALNRASTRCEAVICLLSKHWLNSRECEVEFRYAENLHKAILCARLEPVPDANITSEWQRCDLFRNNRPTTEVDIADGGEPVVLDRVGLQRLSNGLRALDMDKGRKRRSSRRSRGSSPARRNDDFPAPDGPRIRAAWPTNTAASYSAGGADPGHGARSESPSGGQRKCFTPMLGGSTGGLGIQHTLAEPAANGVADDEETRTYDTRTCRSDIRSVSRHSTRLAHARGNGGCPAQSGASAWA
jgi:hypothetical protein